MSFVNFLFPGQDMMDTGQTLRSAISTNMFLQGSELSQKGNMYAIGAQTRDLTQVGTILIYRSFNYHVPGRALSHFRLPSILTNPVF